MCKGVHFTLHSDLSSNTIALTKPQHNCVLALSMTCFRAIPTMLCCPSCRSLSVNCQLDILDGAAAVDLVFDIASSKTCSQCRLTKLRASSCRAMVSWWFGTMQQPSTLSSASPVDDLFQPVADNVSWPFVPLLVEKASARHPGWCCSSQSRHRHCPSTTCFWPASDLFLTTFPGHSASHRWEVDPCLPSHT